MGSDPVYAEKYRIRARRLKYKRKYGISEEIRDQMAADQGYRCLVCKQKAPLCVDHDHESGVVRGLLCKQCNTGIGMFRDNPVLLNHAIKYLMGR
jgi:hypothetical protein